MSGWGPSALTMTLGVVTALSGMVTACTIAPAPEGAPGVAAISELPPPGFGTMLQSEVSLSLTSRELQILVTPLSESVTRVTAPDTYERLSAIAGANLGSTPPGSTLFLVSFFTEEVDVRFIHSRGSTTDLRRPEGTSVGDPTDHTVLGSTQSPAAPDGDGGVCIPLRSRPGIRAHSGLRIRSDSGVECDPPSDPGRAGPRPRQGRYRSGVQTVLGDFSVERALADTQEFCGFPTVATNVP